jgi:hypothetical protein
MANNAFIAPAPGPGANMGEPAPRVDGRLKVTGAALIRPIPQLLIRHTPSW